MLPLIIAAMAGGSIGSWMGSRKMNHRGIIATYLSESDGQTVIQEKM